MKRRLGERLTHQGSNVVIAWHTIDWQLELCEQLATFRVGCLRVVLNHVTGEYCDMCAPAASPVVLDNARQRCMGHDAAQNAGCVAKQMRVRQMQDPDRVIGVVNLPRPQARSMTCIITADDSRGNPQVAAATPPTDGQYR